MLIRFCFLILLITLSQNVEAQELRAFDLCDSTEYILNSDTTIVVGKYNLYAKTNSDFQLVHEFEMPFPDYYIRDFDIIAPDFWYTLVGDRYISNITFLYKSNDRGQSWDIDTTYFNAINSSVTDAGIDPLDPFYYNSINQVQKIGTDTILLFLGYYGSGIVYSIDGGEQWSHWFANQPAHYFGMLECEESYYLYQIEGDGFLGRMFPFDKQFLFRNDSLVNFDHLPSGSGHHPPFHLTDLPYVAYYSNLSNCELNSFLNDYIEDNCSASTTTNTVLSEQSFTIYPNPNDGQFKIDITPPIYVPIEMSIYSYSGQKLFSQSFADTMELMDYQSYPVLSVGSYLISIKSPNRILSKKMVVY